jgi:hypothetical protein
MPSTTNQPIPLTALPVVLTRSAGRDLPSVEKIAYVELINEGSRLRFWKPFDPFTDTLRSDLMWFNGLDIRLFHNRNFVGFARIDRANNPSPDMSNVSLIFDQHIPYLVPAGLQLELPSWPDLFDFDVSAMQDALGITLNFLPPVTTRVSGTSTFAGFRFNLANPDVPLMNAPPVVFATLASGRVTAFFPNFADAANSDVFAIKISRGSFIIGLVAYQKCMSAPDPGKCMFDALCEIDPTMEECQTIPPRR